MFRINNQKTRATVPTPIHIYLADLGKSFNLPESNFHFDNTTYLPQLLREINERMTANHLAWNTTVKKR